MFLAIAVHQFNFQVHAFLFKNLRLSIWMLIRSILQKKIRSIYSAPKDYLKRSHHFKQRTYDKYEYRDPAVYYMQSMWINGLKSDRSKTVKNYDIQVIFPGHWFLPHGSDKSVPICFQ